MTHLTAFPIAARWPARHPAQLGAGPRRGTVAHSAESLQGWKCIVRMIRWATGELSLSAGS